MGKRKSRAKPPPNCHHETGVECHLDMRNLIGEAVCRICQKCYSTTNTALTEPIDIVAIGERGKAPSPFLSTGGPSKNEEGTGNEEMEGQGDTDEVDGISFLASSHDKRKASQPTITSKGKRCEASAASITEMKLDMALEASSSESTATAPATNVVPSIRDCMDIVSEFPGFVPSSKFYNKALRIFWKKEARESFMIPPTNGAKLEFLKSLVEE